MSYRYAAAGVIAARRPRVLFEIDEQGARVALDPAAVAAAVHEARAARRRLFAGQAPRRTALAALLDQSDSEQVTR
ncbi:hypothetical protein [Streptomyces benahoarensis]|uniref:Uncharacterized protein n=1 Tax=Streptomyces benahoarensis TaxID=2595054 RepID=A0A553ZRV0_9ACTN|nr:hypothetical protein [Streptomyces benahoarensis]TSB32381.1 hypothetical protein FNJ62_01845 [Streptomyces benahoarensis]TSB44006.1 hypothetical protein FNZ23_01545 [Streptomyces benahoarensis]